MKITVKTTFVHPAEVDPDERLELAKSKALARGLDPETDADPDAVDISEVQTYGLRYEAGSSYEVDAKLGHLFIGNGWADNAGRSLKAADMSEPWDTRQATDEDAEEAEAAHRESRERDMESGQVTTHTAAGKIYRRRANDKIEVLREADVEVDERGYTLDVQDSTSDAEGRF